MADQPATAVKPFLRGFRALILAMVVLTSGCTRLAGTASTGEEAGSSAAGVPQTEAADPKPGDPPPSSVILVDDTKKPATPPATEKPPDTSTKKEKPALVRTRLRKQPELVCELDMDKTRMEQDYEGAACDAVMSPDGKYIACGGKFGCIRFFTFDGKEAKYVCRRPDPLKSAVGRVGAHRTLVWLDNEKIAGSGSEHVAFIWDTKNFKLVKAFGSSLNESLQLDWCPSRRLLLMAQKAGIVSVWNFDRKYTNNPTKVFDFSTVDNSISHANGIKVLVENMAHYSGDGPVEEAGHEDKESRVEGACWSPDGMQIAAVGAWGLDILDASGKKGEVKHDHMPPLYWKKQQKYFKMTDPVRDMPLVKRIRVPASDPGGAMAARGHRVSWASDGKLVAVGYGLSKSDANKKANGSKSAFIRLFNPKDWSLVREWAPHKMRTYALEFSPDASVLASGGQKEVFLWDPSTKEKLMTFPAHADEVTSTRWSSDGKYLITTAGSERIDSNGPVFTFPSKDRKVRVWRVAD